MDVEEVFTGFTDALFEKRHQRKRKKYLN